MANARYGTIRLSTVSPSDIEIFYTYTPDRETIPDYNINSLSPASQYLKPYYTTPNGTEQFGGLYNLTLPSSVFNQLGIYSIIIRPKQIRLSIVDCGSLSALPNEKGLILSTTNAVDNSGNNVDMKSLVQNLAGYRIEYLNNNNGNLTTLQNYFTIVTSANLASVVSNNTSNVTQKATTYTLNSAGDLIFLTVSPNTSAPVNPNINPFIGEPGQNIILTNTNFNPICLEVELVEATIDDLADYMIGNQIFDTGNGVTTFYNSDLSIKGQSLFYTIQDQYGNPLYQVRQQKTQIDSSEDFNTITGGA